MAYPLQPLLSVRSFRADNAKAAVNAAETALRQAQSEVHARRVELERYLRWLPEEKERRYNAIMGKQMSLADLETFKARLAILDDGVSAREKAVLEAEKIVEERTGELRAARTALTIAFKEKIKVETHKDVWTQATAREAERSAELELEDFTPGVVLQAPGHEEKY